MKLYELIVASVVVGVLIGVVMWSLPAPDVYSVEGNYERNLLDCVKQGGTYRVSASSVDEHLFVYDYQMCILDKTITY